VIQDGAQGTPQVPPPRLLFSFIKEGTASYISHLDMMTVFERSLVRAGVHARFTEGFNPKPRLEFASPLGLGIESDEEIAAVVLGEAGDAEGFIEGMNRALPPGLRVTRAVLTVEQAGAKRRSLMSLHWGSEYLLDGHSLLLPVTGPSIRKTIEAAEKKPEGPARRLRTIASGKGGEPASYFEVLCAMRGPSEARSSFLS
jgi:radical SAM-linked protein